MKTKSGKRAAFPKKAGFTIAEIMVSVGIMGVVGTLLLSLVQASSVLLAKNVGINLSHTNARLGNEKLLSLVQSSVGAPILVDSSLNVAAGGNGPAAGIIFQRLASTFTYTAPNAVAATATSFTLRRTSNTNPAMPAPQSGDVLFMIGKTLSSPYTVGFQADISSVTTLNSTDFTVNFASSVGSLCDPPATSGNVLPASTKLFLLDKMACVAVGTELRLLGSVGAPTSYQVLAQLVPINGQTTCLPFSYTEGSRRWVNVDLRVQSTEYSKRNLGTSNTFFDLKQSIAYRSAIFVQTAQ